MNELPKLQEIAAQQERNGYETHFHMLDVDDGVFKVEGWQMLRMDGKWDTRDSKWSVAGRLYRRKLAKPEPPDEVELDIKWASGPLVRAMDEHGDYGCWCAFIGLAHYENVVEYRLQCFEFANGLRNDKSFLNGRKSVKAIFWRVRDEYFKIRNV